MSTVSIIRSNVQRVDTLSCTRYTCARVCQQTVLWCGAVCVLVTRLPVMICRMCMILSNMPHPPNLCDLDPEDHVLSDVRSLHSTYTRTPTPPTAAVGCGDM